MNNPKTSEEQEVLARRRAELIIQVRSGAKTASAAADELGISRKTYYEWEHRGLEAMIEALGNRTTGRPATARDPEKDALLNQVEELQKQLSVLEQRIVIRDILHSAEDEAQKKSGKNDRG